jgi:hypothetical protein
MKYVSITLLVAGAAIGLAACSEHPGGPTASVSPDIEPAMSKGQARVSLCHATDAGAYVSIEVASPAVPAHMAHGDGTPGTALDDHSGTFTTECDVEVIALDASTTYGTPLAGGGGGGPFDDACAAGSVAVGLSGNYGNYFGWAALWNHRLECRELRGDGTLGAASSTPPRGPLFGVTTDPYSGSCASDGVLTGASGMHQWNVSQVAGDCASVATILAGGAGAPGVGPFTGSGVNSFTPWSSPCMPGYAVTGTYGSSGDILDSVGFRCTQVVKQVS